MSLDQDKVGSKVKRVAEVMRSQARPNENPTPNITYSMGESAQAIADLTLKLPLILL